MSFFSQFFYEMQNEWNVGTWITFIVIWIIIFGCIAATFCLRVGDDNKYYWRGKLISFKKKDKKNK